MHKFCHNLNGIENCCFLQAKLWWFQMDEEWKLETGKRPISLTGSWEAASSHSGGRGGGGVGGMSWRVRSLTSGRPSEMSLQRYVGRAIRRDLERTWELHLLPMDTCSSVSSGWCGWGVGYGWLLEDQLRTVERSFSWECNHYRKDGNHLPVSLVEAVCQTTNRNAMKEGR